MSFTSSAAVAIDAERIPFGQAANAPKAKRSERDYSQQHPLDVVSTGTRRDSSVAMTREELQDLRNKQAQMQSLQQ